MRPLDATVLTYSFIKVNFEKKKANDNNKSI